MSATRLRNHSSRNTSPKVALSVAVAVLVAVGIAGLVHVLWPPASTATAPTYSIDPTSVSLTTSDVGPTFRLVNDGALGPTQRTAPGHPLPYQEQFMGGWARNYMVETALVPPGSTELDTYEQAHGFPPTNPPTIFGPFVADHQGLFEVSDLEVSYHVASAAHLDFLVSYPSSSEIANYKANYDNWQTYPIQLGDEADAWGGIRDSPTGPPHAFEEQVFVVRWRHGPVVSTIFLRGAHDLTLDTALHFAHIVDARIASAMQQAAKGPSHASNLQELATSVSVYLAVCALDRRIGHWVHWT
jgi:hypothetical protein